MRAACTLHAKSSRGVRGRNGEGVKVKREEKREREEERRKRRPSRSNSYCPHQLLKQVGPGLGRPLSLIHIETKWQVVLFPALYEHRYYCSLRYTC